MVVAFYFRLHLAYFPRPVVAIFARPEQHPTPVRLSSNGSQILMDQFGPAHQKQHMFQFCSY